MRDIQNRYKLLENQTDLNDSSKLSQNQDGDEHKVDMSDSIIHDLTVSRRVPNFKLKFQYNNTTVRKRSLDNKSNKRMSAHIDRVVCYSIFDKNSKGKYKAYLDLKNQKVTTFITLIRVEGLIKLVENALSSYTNTYFGYDNSMKVVTLFDYQIYVMKENNQSMLVVSKCKYSGVKYSKDKSNLFRTKSELFGDRELRWSILVIFNNLKTMFRSLASEEDSSADPNMLSPNQSKRIGTIKDCLVPLYPIPVSFL